MTEPRDCGPCSLCCKVYRINDLRKPAGRLCGHASSGGCAIHGAHPPICQAFQCAWLQAARLGGEALDARWKPELAGFVISATPDGYRLSVTVDPDRPEAWRAEPYYAALKRWALGARRDEISIIVYVGDGAWAVFPEEDLFAGAGRDEADAYSTGYFRSAGQRRPYVAVRASSGRVFDVRGGAYPEPA